MSDVTRILWSGLTGRTGREAVEQLLNVDGVEIVVGMSRHDTDFNISEKFECIQWLSYDTGVFGLGGLIHQTKQKNVGVIVDFSHPDVFEKVLELAIRAEKPLISGTSGLSDRQIASLYDATNRIPVFRGGNFRFKVKKFIDEAVELAKKEEGQLDLYEIFYKGKSLPSETSKVIQRRIREATGRMVKVHSSDTFDRGNLICDWELQVHRRLSPTAIHQEKVRCRTIGFDELAHDVLEIAKVMKGKPIKRGEFYDLDEIWDDIPEEAKIVK